MFVSVNKRHKFKKSLVLLLVVCLIFSTFPVNAFALDAENNSVSYTYDFHKLGVASQSNPKDVQETLEGWSIIEHSDPIDKQSFGIDVEGNSAGSFIRLSFSVPTAGTYTAKISGFNGRCGGLADIIIDGNTVGEYNFSADSGAAGAESILGNVTLTAGIHELMLSVKAAGASGDHWYYMYPTSLKLDTPVNNGDIQCCTYDFHKLGVASQSNPSDVQETQEGWSIIEYSHPIDKQSFGIDVEGTGTESFIRLSFNVPTAGTYAVKFSGFNGRCGGLADIIIDGNTVGEYSFSADSGTAGKEATLGNVTLTAGAHELKLFVKAAGAYGDNYYYMYPTTFKLDVPVNNGDIQCCTYDFHKLGVASQSNPKDVQETLEGWSIIEHSDPIDKQSFGIDVEGNSTGSSISLRFNVPAAGDYFVKFSGLRSRCGGVADILIDDSKVGQYNFSADTGIPGDLTLLGKHSFTAGDHVLKLVVVEAGAKGANWYYMYPTNFVLDTKSENDSGGSSDTGNTVIADTISDPSVFDFHKLGVASLSNPADVQETQEGWSIKEHSDPIDRQSFGIDVEGNSTGSYITLKFKVPKNDSYNVLFSGFKGRCGGIADILIDDSKVGQYNFSADAGKQGDMNLFGNLSLSAGDHVLKLIVTAAGDSGDKYYYMYPSSFVLQPCLGDTVTSAKTRSTVYTQEKVATARENIQNYVWARAIRDNAVKTADMYLSYGDDNYWWSIVTPHTIPRSLGVITRDKLPDGACPQCGKALNAYGYYPWILDPIGNPFKMTCPSCKTTFPTNDFDAYYKSGINEHGVFDSKIADKNLLKNTLYPEKGENWGVDDGYGWKDANGKTWTFIAYYNHFALWYEAVNGIIPKALNAFREAYLYTGDIKYAHAGIILLDRIADVYPAMDIQEFPWFKGFDNGTPSWNVCQGKILNETWEDFLINDFAYAYDAFYSVLKDGDSANVVDFLKNKAATYKLYNPKATVNHIKKNIEDNILREVFKAFKNAQMQGNFGMPQGALALTAVVLDEPGTTKEMLDYNFKSGGLVMNPDPDNVYGRKFTVTGGDILNTLVNVVDRDGFGNEASPGYNSIWIDYLKIAADVLDGYRLPDSISDEEKDKYDLYKNIKFRKMFYSFYLTCIGKGYPAIGDSGSCSDSGVLMNLENCITAFEKFGDQAFAQMAYMQNGNTAYGLHSSIFTSDPEKISRDVDNIIKSQGAINLGSSNLTGFGFTALRDGTGYVRGEGVAVSFPQLEVTDASGKEYKTLTNYNCELFKADGPDQSITFNFPVMKSDNYEIALQTVLAPIYGQYAVKIDGTQIGDVYDAFAETIMSAEAPKTLGKFDLTAGTHQISFTCVGKNSENTSADLYFIGLQKLILRDKDAQFEANKSVPPDTQRDLWVYYGRNNGHGHKDTLNIGLHAFGINLAPELGYPDNMGEDPKRLQWIRNTISHNTVVVDKAGQSDQFIGIPQHFDNNQVVKLFDISAPKVYNQTQIYKRTSAMIKVDDKNSFIVDFFRVKGGNDHHYSFHGAEGTVSTEGLKLTAQEGGSYAGADVPFGIASGANAESGFSWLKNVQREDKPTANFSVDWNLKQDTDVHLNFTMLGELDDVALADGITPDNPSNPPEFKYMIAHRKGENLSSMFTSVIEPYKGERYIKSIDSAVLKVDGKKIESDDARAVKITLKDGRVNYVIISLDKDVTYTVDDKFQFKGFFGVYTEKDGRQVYGYVNDGTAIGSISNNTGRIAGTVVDFTKDLSFANEIIIKPENSSVDINDMIGKYIYVENDEERNASYPVKNARQLSDGNIRLDIGDSTTIRGYKDSNDFSKGYIYDVADNSRFVIPLSSDGYTNPADNQTSNSVAEPETQSDVIKLKPELVNGKAALAKINAESLNNALKQAVSDADGVKTVKIEIEALAGAQKYVQQIPAAEFSKKMEKDKLEIKTPFATVNIAGNMFNENTVKGASNVELEIGRADTSNLTEEQKTAIGSKPVIEINVRIDNKNAKWHNNSAPVTVSMEYKPTAEELKDPEHIVVWYIDEKGKVSSVPSGRYDTKTGMITFTTTHFSKYAAAYVERSFNDLAACRPELKKLIEVLASKGIINGTSKTTFSPDSNVTRADVIVLLVRTLGLNAEFDSNFSDVKQGSYYYEAVGTAKKLGITKGIGGGKFNADSKITKQEMAVLVDNALKVAGKAVSTEKSYDIKKFDDFTKVSSYAEASISRLLDGEFLENSGNSINPFEIVTRAQVAKVIYKAYNK